MQYRFFNPRTYIRFPSNTGELRNGSSVLRATSLYSRPGWTTTVMPASELMNRRPPARVTLA